MTIVWVKKWNMSKIGLNRSIIRDNIHQTPIHLDIVSRVLRHHYSHSTCHIAPHPRTVRSCYLGTEIFVNLSNKKRKIRRERWFWIIMQLAWMINANNKTNRVCWLLWWWWWWSTRKRLCRKFIDILMEWVKREEEKDNTKRGLR